MTVLRSALYEKLMFYSREALCHDMLFRDDNTYVSTIYLASNLLIFVQEVIDGGLIGFHRWDLSLKVLLSKRNAVVSLSFTSPTFIYAFLCNLLLILLAIVPT